MTIRPMLIRDKGAHNFCELDGLILLPCYGSLELSYSSYDNIFFTAQFSIAYVLWTMSEWIHESVAKTQNGFT